MKFFLNTLNVKNIPEFNTILSEVGRLINIDSDRGVVLNEIQDTYAYIASASIQIDEEFLENANQLKVIGSRSTGTDHMSIDLIKSKNIICFDISKEFALLNTFTATSEIAFTLLLSLLRKVIPAELDAKNGIWAREKYSGNQLFGKTMGILGLGRLGTISANIARGFGMNVIAHDTQKKI